MSPPAEAPTQLLVFRLGEESFAFPVSAVREVVEYTPLTPVPLLPRCVRGVMNLRGRVVPVVDLQRRFERGETEPGRRTGVVLLDRIAGGAGGPVDVGVMVDAVSDVLEIAPGALEAPPAFGASVRTEFIAGLARAEGRFVILLDTARLFSLEELTRLGATG